LQDDDGHRVDARVNELMGKLHGADSADVGGVGQAQQLLHEEATPGSALRRRRTGDQQGSPPKVPPSGGSPSPRRRLVEHRTLKASPARKFGGASRPVCPATFSRRWMMRRIAQGTFVVALILGIGWLLLYTIQVAQSSPKYQPSEGDSGHGSYLGRRSTPFHGYKHDCRRGCGHEHGGLKTDDEDAGASVAPSAEAFSSMPLMARWASWASSWLGFSNDSSRPQSSTEEADEGPSPIDSSKLNGKGKSVVSLVSGLYRTGTSPNSCLTSPSRFSRVFQGLSRVFHQTQEINWTGMLTKEDLERAHGVILSNPYFAVAPQDDTEEPPGSGKEL
jgi:hypothetical protein